MADSLGGHTVRSHGLPVLSDKALLARVLPFVTHMVVFNAVVYQLKCKIITDFSSPSKINARCVSYGGRQLRS